MIVSICWIRVIRKSRKIHFLVYSLWNDVLDEFNFRTDTKLAGVRINALVNLLFQVHLERKTREAEFLTARLVEESEKRAAEAERLKVELLTARVAEKQAKEKLLNFLSRTSSGSLPPVRIFI